MTCQAAPVPDGLPEFPVPVGSTVRIVGRRGECTLVGWHGRGSHASVILMDADQQRRFVRFDSVQWAPKARTRGRRARKGDRGDG